MLDSETIKQLGVYGVFAYLVLKDVVPKVIGRLRKDTSAAKVQGLDKDMALLAQRAEDIENRMDEHHQILIQSLTDHTEDDVRRFDAVHDLLVQESKSRREDIQDVREIQVRQLERLGRIDAHLEHILVSRPRKSDG